MVQVCDVILKSTVLTFWQFVLIMQLSQQRIMMLLLAVWTASTERSQIESSLYQKANERVQLGVLYSWPVSGDASASTFALAARYSPSQESTVKV